MKCPVCRKVMLSDAFRTCSLECEAQFKVKQPMIIVDCEGARRFRDDVYEREGDEPRG